MSHRYVIVALRAFFLVSLISGSVTKAATTQYSYDNLGRVTQAAQSNGSNLQYQYDANGNLTQAIVSTPALTLNTPLDISVTTPGQVTTLNFTATQGQFLTLTLTGISSAAGITVSIRDPSGQLVTTKSGSTVIAVNIPNTVAGTYSIVITPQSSSTAAMQVSLAPTASDSNTADAPLPTWAMVLLGMSLLGMIQWLGLATNHPIKTFLRSRR